MTSESQLVRVSFSIEDGLYRRLEALLRRHGVENRSEYLRDLIRDRLVEQEWKDDDESVGTITLVYDHHARQLSERLLDLQHRHHDAILATTHVHLDSHLCVEAIIARGRASQLAEIADTLRRQRGVLHSRLSMSTTGRELR